MIGHIKKNIKIIVLAIVILVSFVPVGIEIKENRVAIYEKDISAETPPPGGTVTPTPPATVTPTPPATEEPAVVRVVQEVVEDDSTSIGGWFSGLKDVALRPFVWLVLLIPTLLKQLAALILWISGTFLNFSVILGITKMGEIIDSATAIKSAWGIVRDIVNIFFIFGLLYLSVMTIIGGWSDNIKKRLSLLIIAGLLINFSFFFTSIFVDISNVVTLSIYGKMEACQSTKPENDSLTGYLKVLEKGGLSDCFAKKIGFSSTFTGFTSPSGDTLLTQMDRKGKNDKEIGLIQKIITLLFATLIFLLVAIVFFAISIAIFGRFMIIIFLLITSPIMFAGWVLPKLEEHTSAWTKKLGEQLIFLPAMFLMLYIGYELAGGIIESTKVAGFGSDNSPAFANIFSNFGSDLIGSLINLAITLGFIIGALIIGKKLGAVGMEVASLIGFGAVAAIGAGTLGAAGAGLSKFGSREGAGRISRKLGMAGEWASRRSFDVRQLPGAQTTLKNVGFDPGKPSKAAAGGYRARGEAKGAALLEREEAYGKFRPADQQATKDNVNERANRLTGERSDVKAKKTELGSVDADINRAETDLKKMQSDAAKLDAEIEELKKQDWDPNIKVDIQKKQESRAKMTGAIAAQQSLVSSAKGRKEDISKELGQIISKHSQADTERALQSFGGVYKNKHAVQAQVKKMKKGEMDKLKEELIKQMKKDSAAESNK